MTLKTRGFTEKQFLHGQKSHNSFRKSVLTLRPPTDTDPKATQTHTHTLHDMDKVRVL